MLVTGSTEYGPVFYPSQFQKAVANSQNESLRKETSVDIVAVKGGGVLCIEVKKLNPRYVNWIFAKHSVDDDGFPAVNKVVSAVDPVDLLHVPKPHRGIPGLSVRTEPRSLEYFSPRKYDQGLSLTLNKRGEYSFESNSLAGAARQIVEGTFGLVVESIIKHVSSGKGGDQSFVPIVVTTANILVCEHDPHDLDESDASKVILEPRDAVIYDCPVPMRAKFPNQIVDVEDREQTLRFIRWPVLVVNLAGLGQFLR